MPEYWCFELVKLLAQCLLAFVAAWFAVFLALRRFKSEKIWERRMQAYHDVAFALAVIIRRTRSDYNNIENGRSRSESVEQQSERRKMLAHHKLDEAIAIASMFLPIETCKVLDNLDKELSADVDIQTYEDYFNPYLAALERALKLIRVHGREHADLKPLPSR